jgi:hypothetical protein
MDPHRPRRRLPLARCPVTGHPAAGRITRPARPRPATIKMDIPVPLRTRVGVIRDQLAASTGRSPTLPETLERIVDYWEQEHQS